VCASALLTFGAAFGARLVPGLNGLPYFPNSPRSSLIGLLVPNRLRETQREKLGSAVLLVYYRSGYVHVARAMPAEQQHVPGSSLSRCWHCYRMLVRRTVQYWQLTDMAPPEKVLAYHGGQAASELMLHLAHRLFLRRPRRLYEDCEAPTFVMHMPS
jgi:hypothetical protein